jgi:hypothetical protein
MCGEDADADETTDKPTSIEEVPKNEMGSPHGVWYDEDGNVKGHVRSARAPPEDLEFDG